jgi:hypothetical protein
MTALVLRPRHALWLLIAALHLLVLSWLTPPPRPPHMPSRQVIELTLWPQPRLREPRHEQAPTTRSARPARPEVRPAPTPASDDATRQPPAEPGPAIAVEAPPAPAASTTSLLHSEGTRRAIHLATRAPLLSERAASASDAPARENAQQRFGRAVASSAYGNCLKGEFPGGGMELLSLPFWIAAEASGKCRK